MRPRPAIWLGAKLAWTGVKAQRLGWLLAARSAHRAALQIDPAQNRAIRELLKLAPKPEGARQRLRYLSIGTTGLCNASCLNCPTGKAATSHVPRVPMDISLFQGIIDTVLNEGWPLLSIHFGLFGDGLVDPFVVERARYTKQQLPDVMLDVNTNGAAFDRTKHSALASQISLLTLHCESLRPDIYERLMPPLRAKNVFPKYEPILEVFAGKVRVSVPVTRLNLDELGDMRKWFMDRGAKEVIFDPLSSRCAVDDQLFRDLALAPLEVRCRPDILEDVIIDCDGAILACCQDFERREVIGDASKAGLLAALQDPRRRAFEQALVENRHLDLTTCRHCQGDARTPQFPFDQISEKLASPV